MVATFGGRLRRLREEKELKQTELAKLLNLESSSTISQYENEALNRIPDAHILKRLAEIFSVSTDYLLGRTDDPTPPSDEHLTPEEYDRRVVAALSRSDGYGEPLTKEEIDDILKYIRWTREKHRMEKEKKSDS